VLTEKEDLQELKVKEDIKEKEDIQVLVVRKVRKEKKESLEKEV